MENISEMIWEVIYVVLLVIGITFIFLIFRNLNKSTDTVNEEVRTKMDIQEDNMGYTGYNVVDGTSVYYDIVNADRDIQENMDMYRIKIYDSMSAYEADTSNTKGTEISHEAITKAMNGDASLILATLNGKLNGYFRKFYQQNASGNISQVNYVYIGNNRKTATGLN